MGTFQQEIVIFSPDGARSETLSATVDTGSTYTQIPAGVARRLGLDPEEQRNFRLAGGRRVRRGVVYADVSVEGKRIPTLCVIAGADSPPLLGAVTLEQLGVAPDPIAKRLVPTEGLLLTLLDEGLLS